MFFPRSVVVHSEDPYGFGIADVFRNVAEEKNITLLATVSLPTGDSDDTTFTARIISAAEQLSNAIRNPNTGQPLDVGTFIYLGSSSLTFNRLLRECEKKNITGSPYLWLGSDGGSFYLFFFIIYFFLVLFGFFFFFFLVTIIVPYRLATSLDFASADTGLKPETRRGIMATTLYGSDSPKYRDLYYSEWVTRAKVNTEILICL